MLERLETLPGLYLRKLEKCYIRGGKKNLDFGLKNWNFSAQLLFPPSSVKRILPRTPGWSRTRMVFLFDSKKPAFYIINNGGLVVTHDHNPSTWGIVAEKRQSQVQDRLGCAMSPRPAQATFDSTSTKWNHQKVGLSENPLLFSHSLYFAIPSTPQRLLSTCPPRRHETPAVYESGATRHSFSDRSIFFFFLGWDQKLRLLNRPKPAGF